MTASAELRSGKGHTNENFPVASLLIRRRHRPAILAFYEFVRTADDVADHSQLAADEKIARLDALEASLLGKDDAEPEGVKLRKVLRERGLSPQHAQDLLQAFRRDAVKLRYADWDELFDYCRYSAMPVGRYVLEVHGESRAIWPANDALCAALQIINHVQDCAADYRNLDRVYIPLDALAAHGLGVEALGETHASPALTECLRGVVDRTAVLLEQSRVFATLVSDSGLAMEIAAIQALAERLITILRTHDPLSEPVHLGKGTMLATAASAAALSWTGRLFRRAAPTYRPQERGF